MSRDADSGTAHEESHDDISVDDCQRKFSIPYVQSSPENRPNELAWLINEVGMLITRLTQLISQLNAKLDSVETEPLSQNAS